MKDQAARVCWRWRAAKVREEWRRWAVGKRGTSDGGGREMEEGERWWRDQRRRRAEGRTEGQVRRRPKSRVRWRRLSCHVASSLPPPPSPPAIPTPFNFADRLRLPSGQAFASTRRAGGPAGAGQRYVSLPGLSAFALFLPGLLFVLRPVRVGPPVLTSTPPSGTSYSLRHRHVCRHTPQGFARAHRLSGGLSKHQHRGVAQPRALPLRVPHHDCRHERHGPLREDTKPQLSQGTRTSPIPLLPTPSSPSCACAASAAGTGVALSHKLTRGH